MQNNTLLQVASNLTPFCSVLIKSVSPPFVSLSVHQRKKKTDSLCEQSRQRGMTAREAIKSWHHKKCDRVTVNRGGIRTAGGRQFSRAWPRATSSRGQKPAPLHCSRLHSQPQTEHPFSAPARAQTREILHLLKIDTDASRLQHQRRHCKILNTTEDCSQTDSSQWCPHTLRAPWAIRLWELLKGFSLHGQQG